VEARNALVRQYLVVDVVQLTACVDVVLRRVWSRALCASKLMTSINFDFWFLDVLTTWTCPVTAQ